MTSIELLERGREAYRRRSWGEAYRSLLAADKEVPLEGQDLWYLAVAASLSGNDRDFIAALERLHNLQLTNGQVAAAVRSAFWVGFRLLLMGEAGRGSGWLSRAQRLLEREELDTVEVGYLLLPQAERQLAGGDFDASFASADAAAETAQRFADQDLLSLSLYLQGRSRLKQGRLREGLQLLDEAMLSVSTGELSVPVTGVIYCGVISACRSVYELRRAQEWTTALSNWCEGQEGLVAFAGRCLVHRSEILQLHGEWNVALAEARRAWERCSPAGAVAERGAAAAAYYQEGEVQRLLGNHEAAENSFREALQQGFEPQPGLALLRLAQGQGMAALAAIRRTLGDTDDRLKRARLLPALVEIALANGGVEEARGASEELEQIAADFPTSVLATIAAHSRGAVELAAGNAATASTSLRAAWRGWQEFEAPYEAARASVLLSAACQSLGDRDGAKLELEAARRTFRRLGAEPDLARLDVRDEPSVDYGLTARELEVLRLLARGDSNKAIARELQLSERTVHRHVSNIFLKLEVSSRSAATAFAFQHDLV